MSRAVAPRVTVLSSLQVISKNMMSAEVLPLHQGLIFWQHFAHAILCKPPWKFSGQISKLFMKKNSLFYFQAFQAEK